MNNPDNQNTDTRPDFIRNNEVGTGEIEFGDKKIPYTVLGKSLEPRLPGFLGFSNKEHLFISEEAPEAFRAPQLIHEIIEFTELDGQKGRCLSALKRELELVPEEIKAEYIKYRRNFFAKLLEYYKDSDRHEFVAEIRGSFEYLMSIN